MSNIRTSDLLRDIYSARTPYESLSHLFESPTAKILRDINTSLLNIRQCHIFPIEKAFESASGTIALQNATRNLVQTSTFLDDIYKTSRFIESINSQRASILASANGLASVVESISTGIPSFSLWANQHFNTISRLQKSILQLDGLRQRLSVTPRTILGDALATISASIETHSSIRSIHPQMLFMSDNYLHFSEKQFARLINYGKRHDAHKMEVGNSILEAASELYYEECTLINIPEDVEDISSDEFVQLPIQCNLFESLNSHLAVYYSRKTRVPIDEAIPNSIPVKIFNLGCSIIRLVTFINENWMLNDKGLFSKVTNRSLMSALAIPNIISGNKENFGEVIDYLYFLLYEDTGAGKRLTDVLARDDLNAIWDVKALRRFFRHDVEHDESGQKKMADVGEVFNRLIGKRQPSKSGDWRQAQLTLYSDIVNVLEEIYKTLNN